MLIWEEQQHILVSFSFTDASFSIGRESVSVSLILWVAEIVYKPEVNNFKTCKAEKEYSCINLKMLLNLFLN